MTEYTPSRSLTFQIIYEDGFVAHLYFSTLKQVKEYFGTIYECDKKIAQASLHDYRTNRRVTGIVQQRVDPQHKAFIWRKAE